MKTIIDGVEIELTLEQVKRLEEQKESKKLKMVSIMNFNPLIDLCKKYVESLEKEGYVDDDLINYIYESAMEAVYGEKCWDYINKLQK